MSGNDTLRASDFFVGGPVEYHYYVLGTPCVNRGVVTDNENDRVSVQWDSGGKSVFFHPLPQRLKKAKI